MGQFFKFVFASCLGVFLALIAIFGIGAIVLTSIAGSLEKPEKISPNTVLHLKFEQPIPEKTNNVQITSIDPRQDEVLGLQEIRRLLSEAKDDKNIKGIFLDAPNGIASGIVTVNEVRKALVDFKSSGKFIISYSDYYTQGSYYLASAADKVIANPMGLVDFRGFSAQIPFFKTLLDKIGVKVQVFYAGKFKSATEPLRRTNMSEENRLQVREYLNQAYDTFLNEISTSRGIPVPDLRKIANEYQGFYPADALKAKLVDQLGYRDDALEMLRQKLGLNKDEKVKMTTLEKYAQSHAAKTDYQIKDKIAIVYAEGDILDGQTEYGSIGSTNYTKILQEVRKDDRVKAVVLRVNSGGGSTIASENIWYEITQIKKAGKPVVVSMGDYAASGGYYISCLADSIVAEPNTLTGSIGVFGTIPSFQGLLNDKLGVNFDTVKTGNFSNGITTVFDMNESEKKLMQSRIDQTYELFLKRVSEGRHMTRDQVHEIAQGRVWTGEKAKQIGLVDEIGDLNKSLEIAAKLAGITSYRTTEYPRTKDPFQQFLESIIQNDESARTDELLKTKLSDWYPYYKMLKEMHDTKGVQARLPFVIPFR